MHLQINRKFEGVTAGTGTREGEVGDRQTDRQTEIKLSFSKVKILAQRPTHISAVATVLIISNTFTVKY